MDNVKVTLVHHTPNYMELIAGAMSKCYEKQATPAAVIKHGIEAGHLSILEHAQATLDIECSLAVLGQLTRHRYLSPTVKSTRGAQFKPEFVVPVTIRKMGIEHIYRRNMELDFLLYNALIEEGVPPEDAAYVLPKGTMTKIRLTGSLRSWYEYLPKRVCRRAMPEHRVVAGLIKKALRKAMPEIFDRNFRDCQNCKEHGCSFH